MQEQFPNIFNKQNSSVNDPFGDVHRPNASDWLDYEGEMGFIIGKECRHVPSDQLHHVSMVILWSMILRFVTGSSEGHHIP